MSKEPKPSKMKNIQKKIVRKALKAVMAYDCETPQKSSLPVTIFSEDEFTIEDRRPDNRNFPTLSYENKFKVLINGYPMSFISDYSLVIFLSSLLKVESKRTEVIYVCDDCGGINNPKKCGHCGCVTKYKRFIKQPLR